MKQNQTLGLRATAALGASALLFSVGAAAADKELLDMLLKNGAINNQQYDQLIKKESLSAKDSHIGNGVVKLGDKGLEFESTDGNFKAAIGGRLQVDSQVNWNSSNLAPNTGTNTTNELADGMSLRRARMHLEGTFYKDYDYRFEYDFTRGGGTTAGGVTDAFIQWNALKPFALTVGQFKEPFSLEEATSNRYTTFIERNMSVNAFSDNPNAYRLGLGASFYEPRWMASAAIMSEPVGGSQLGNNCSTNAVGVTSCNTINTNGATLYSATSNNANGNANRNNGSGNTSWDVTGRAAGRPWYNSETEFLHVGASGSYRSINNNYRADGTLNNGGFLFTSAIGGNVDRTAVLSTGGLTSAKTAATPFELEHFTRFGAESALVYGPFSMQGEYIRTGLSGSGYNDEVLEGYYGYASYFLTGESRQYKAKTAAWDRIKPSRNFDMAGGWGAWEVVGGYDYLNLSDGAVHGGRAQTAKFGVNWYPNSHVRLMANFIHVLNVDIPGLAAAGTPVVNTPSARQQAFNNTNPDMFEVRAQLDF
jgi:phosphate-selective porin OprO/OprP